MPVQNPLYEEIDLGVVADDKTGDPLRVGGGKINRNFYKIFAETVSFVIDQSSKTDQERLRARENIGDNILVRLKQTDAQGNKTNLASAVNAMPPFSIDTNELYYFSTYDVIVSASGVGIPVMIGSEVVYVDVVTKFWIFNGGHGRYGTGQTPVNESNFPFYTEISSQTQTPVTFDLGEIGTQNIEDVINSSGPYGVSEGTTVIFTATRSGEDYAWIWKGNQETIGTGYPATTSADYYPLNSSIPAPPSGAQPVVVHDVTSNTTAGAIKPGDIVLAGTTITEFVEQLLIDTYEPTFEAPFAVLSVNIDKLQEIGTNVSFDATMDFSRGKIIGDLVGGVWDENAIQAPRAGAATNYKFNGVSQSGAVKSMTMLITDGSNDFSATVEYDAGVQPIDSNGDNFDTPYPAGSIQKTYNFIGAYPLYATTVNINTATKQPLLNMDTANNVEIELVAETGGNKQFFEIPIAWTVVRPLLEIQHYNPISGEYSGDMSASYTKTTVTHGNTSYDRYTNNGAPRGDIKIRLIF